MSRLAFALALACACAGCEEGRAQDGAEPEPVPESGYHLIQLTYRVQGGLLGLDVELVVDAEGAAELHYRTAADPEPAPRRATLSLEERDELVRLLREADFFHLPDRLRPPEGQFVADGLTLEISFVGAWRASTVRSETGAEEPQAFRALVAALDSLVERLRA